MNKKQREKIKKLKQKKEITYQEAWNKVCEYMNKSGILTFFIQPWNNGGNPRYSLQTINHANGGYTEHFVSDKERR